MPNPANRPPKLRMAVLRILASSSVPLTVKSIGTLARKAGATKAVNGSLSTSVRVAMKGRKDWFRAHKCLHCNQSGLWTVTDAGRLYAEKVCPRRTLERLHR